MTTTCSNAVFRGSAGLIVAFSLATAAGASEITPQEKKLIPLAKQEGEIITLSSLFQDKTVRALEDGFRKRYGLGPDFKYTNIRKGTGPTISTARQEIKAGRITFDVIVVPGGGFFHGAAEAGAFLPLDSGQWKYHEANAKKANALFEYPHFVIASSYTFQPIWNATCPGMENVNITSYADILDPKYKGKTIASDITKSVSYATTILALQEAGFDVEAMWKKQKAQDPLVAFRTEPKMQMVINCERPIDMWNLVGRAYQSIEKEPSLAKKLRWGTYKEGQVLLNRQTAVMKGAPHPNAGKLFIEFLLSKEGLDIVAEREASLITYREGYTAPESVQKYLIDLSKAKVLGVKSEVEAYKQFKELRQRWRKVFQ